MSATVMRCFEYTITCDICEAQEVYHTNDHENGIRVHSLETALQASRYRRWRGMHLCPNCQKERMNVSSNSISNDMQNHCYLCHSYSPKYSFCCKYLRGVEEAIIYCTSREDKLK